MIKHSLIVARIFPILLLAVVCQGEPQRERFIVELEQKTVFPNQSFFIRRDQHRLPVNPSGIADTYGYARLASPPDKEPDYRAKTTIIESISWCLLYAKQLYVGYELTPTSKDAALSSTPYSWLPVEMVIIIGWLLKNYCPPYSASFNAIEQQEVSQDHLFVSITMVPDSGDNRPLNLPSESSGQRIPENAFHLAGSFTGLMYSGSGSGNGGPQPSLHTLGLNCFVLPCHGFCTFRPSSDDRGTTEWPLNPAESSTGKPALSMSAEAGPITDSAERINNDVTAHGNLPFTANDWFIVNCLLNLRGHSLPEEMGLSSTHSNLTRPMESSSSGYPPSEGATHYQHDLSNHRRKNDIGRKDCDVSLVREDGLKRPSGRVCKNTEALLVHKSSYHTGQKTCEVPLVRNDGQQRRCGIVCKNAKTLWYHKRKFHSKQQNCNVTVVSEDGQLRPCGAVFKNVQDLSLHKSRNHAGQKSCDVTVFGEDGQPRPCGKISKNAQALSSHKSGYHSGQKNCDMAVIGKDGQPRPCGKVCNNAQALSNHKKRDHCGPQTCDAGVIGEDGLLRPCGKVCNDTKSLSSHKRIHRKRKPVDVTRNDDPSPEKAKLNK
ncbi:MULTISPECIES: hypothetical protein [unclassified Endozoicomonas]|uniref:hypothetical protein n=1 Tax=unclassified Endozoicomonas TaxID=2644528 RepID=UPI0021494A10|nr:MULTISPECIES: hypothetical protein [unclassified Endozoicomonas]